MCSHECPTCGTGFETRRGLAVHHTRVHDEQLPNRTCAACGESFHETYEKRYCSPACRDRSTSNEGADNPNYRGGQTTTTCEECGATFDYYESEKPGRFCPDCVTTCSWRDPPSRSGAQNPQWNGGKVKVRCDVCNEVVRRHPSNVTGEVVVCSNQCRREWLSETFSGGGHPNWTGGGNEAYGQGWDRVRRAALERDDYECVNCGKSKAAIGRNPDVHHIVPVRLFEAHDELSIGEAHHLENVVCLCVSCHRRAEFGHIERSELLDSARSQETDDDRIASPYNDGPKEKTLDES